MLTDQNKPFDKNSWFWPYLKTGLDYYSLEVYSMSEKLLCSQYQMASEVLELLDMKIPISQLIIPADSSIKDALVNLNNSALGICFICDEENILIGTITDGDIRRKLLSGSNLTDGVISAANTNFCFLNYESSSKDILASLKKALMLFLY